MAHLCVPQNQALGVCRGFVLENQVWGTRGREDLANAIITSNAEEEEDFLFLHLTPSARQEQPRTECDGGGSLMAYAPLGAMGISK